MSDIIVCILAKIMFVLANWKLNHATLCTIVPIGIIVI